MPRPTSRRRILHLFFLTRCLSVLFAGALAFGSLSTWTSAAQRAADPTYDTLFYTHDGLQLEAYLYKPLGPGPFPVVIYNHGSRLPGDEQTEFAAPFIGRLLVPAGYAVVVPERRGYGKSGGTPFSREVGQDRGHRFVARLNAEAGDVNAAVEHVLGMAGSSLDAKRVFIMGWSFGGIVTTLAASQSGRFAAMIVQAPGALNWNRSEELRKAMGAAAAKIRVPTQCAVAQNDLTTESARAVCAAIAANGTRADLKVYPPFEGGRPLPGNPPGHALFGPFGVADWRQDVLTFLADAAR